MNYFSSFEVSLAGMSVEKARMETVAMNIANMNATAPNGSAAYRPLSVAVGAEVFSKELALVGPHITAMDEVQNPVRKAYKPSHPHADDMGYVSYPNVNPVHEMLTLVEASRGYEANMRAANAAKEMIRTVLEIGGVR